MFSAAPFSGQYNVTTLEKAMVKIYVWVSISSAFHSIVQQEWDQSGEEREKAERLLDWEMIRNKSLTSDISWTALLLQLVKSCSNFSQLLTSHQMPREDTKNAFNDLYPSLYDIEYF